VGGNIRGVTRVLTTAITLETGMGAFGVSIALGLILLAIALIIVVLMNLITAGALPGTGGILGGTPRE
jgi:tungstate transport system permease protein